MPSINFGRVEALPRQIQLGVGKTFIPASALALKPHRHAFAQLHLVLEGSYIESSRGCDFALGPGSALFRPAQELHSNLFNNTAVHGLLIDIESSTVSELLPGVDVSVPLYFVAHTFDDLCQSFASEARQHAAERNTALRALALTFAARLSRHVRNRAARIPAWVAEAVTLIRGRFADHIRLGALSHEIGVTPARLARAFRRYLHQSVGAFLLEARLQNARSAVLNGTAPLTEVALFCGFFDQAHLTRAFRRRYGITPGELRRLR